MANLYLNLPAPSANAAGDAVDVSGMGQLKTIVVGSGGGHFEAVVTVEYATDEAGENFAPIAGFQGPGHKTVEVAARWMRVVTSGYKSGSINVDVGGSGNGCEFAEVTSSPASIAALPPFKTVVVDGGFTGAVNIEVSEDGTSWAQVMTFLKAGGQSSLVYGQFVRATNANGDVPSIWMGAGNDGGYESGTPAFESVVHRIFVNEGGSDQLGDGKTYATAYRTLERACQDRPHFGPPGHIWKIDATDLGDVNALIADYELPRWASSHAFTVDFGEPYFYIQSGVNITADFKIDPDLTLPQATINIGSVITADPDTDILSIQDPTKVGPNAWVPGALKGKLCVGAFGLFERSVIYDNTSDTIFITSASSTTPTLPAQIMVPSARVQTTGTKFGFAGGLNIVNQDSLTIGGIKFEPTDPSFPSIHVQSGQVWFLSNDIDFVSCADPLRQNGFENNNLTNPFFNGPTYLLGNRVVGMIELGRPAQLQINSIEGNVFDACAPIKVVDGAIGLAPIGGLLLIQNTLIMNSTGNAVEWYGGNALIAQTKIENAVGDALHFTGPGLHKLEGVVGTGNGGVGIRVNNGAHVQKDAATTVTGAADQKVGDLPSGAYPANPFNIVDFTYDPTLGAPAQVTGTGARLFDPTP